MWRISYIRADYAKIDFLSRADKAAQAEASSIVSLWKNANIKSKQRLWKSQWDRPGNWRKVDIGESLMQQNAITFVVVIVSKLGVSR